MARHVGWCAALLIFFLPSLVSGASATQIDDAIARSVSWLYDQQLPDHTWERDFPGHGDQRTGQTALAVYALLSAGQSRTDPRIASAIEYLEKTQTTGVYALGMRCQVWLMLPPTPEVRQAMTSDARVLLQSVKRTGDAQGFYDYNPSGDKTYSHSRAQYAVLGLWAAAQMGVPVPNQYWQLVEKAWIAHQDPSGGWNYIFKRSQYPVTAGMTAVGVATLLITQEFASPPNSAARPGGAGHPAIQRGIKWLADHVQEIAADSKSPRAYPFATLYAIERIGVFSGTRYLGGVDWYGKGADFLLNQQRRDGSFPPEYDSKVVSTCFALLFLSRGGYPLMMSKLDYSASGPQGAGSRRAGWNVRPRDLANLSRWTAHQIERELNWQTVSIESPVRDWQAAPILYISGNQPLDFTVEQQAKLKQFAEEGGLILANAEGASQLFIRSFQSLGTKLFPAYEFRPLPANHVIYTNEQFKRSKWQRKPTVSGLSNGVRELMLLLSDSDPARAWQARDRVRRAESFELGSDIFLYAVDKTHLRRRGESNLVTTDSSISATQTIKLARIEYNGNWDPEPAGWRRLASILHNQQKIDLKIEALKPQDGHLAGSAFAHLTGTTAFKLDPAAREQIRNFVIKGGTLIVDAAGGSSEFATSAEEALRAMFPAESQQLSQPLPVDHPLYATAEGRKIPIEYRPFARTRLGQLKGPQLRAMTFNNRIGVIYSRQDLSAGLVGENVDGIAGYTPETACALMQRMLTFAPAK
jgi:hypothetical protein